VRTFLGFVRKEVYHILRDRRTLAILLLLPVVQLLLFGSAIRTDVRDVRLAVVDPSPDAATLEIRSRLAASPYFSVVAVLPSVAPLDALFTRGDAQQALVFEPGFAQRLARRGEARVLLVSDATDPNTSTTMQTYAANVVQGYERELRGAGGGGRGGGVRIVSDVRMQFNPTLESAYLFVPGLLAFILTIVSALMTSVSITREKETGTMEVLLVSPLRPPQIIVGKVLPYLALSLVNVVVALLAARLVFGVPVRGSVVLLLAECTLFIVCTLALGVLISTRTSSQLVAMQGSLMGLMMPTVLLSGFIFPVASMPEWLQLLSNAVPAKWFLIIVRGIMLKGVGLAYLWEETLVLAGMTLLLLAASARNFKVRLG
jgi:ABC-2 type transport system permease protein